MMFVELLEFLVEWLDGWSWDGREWLRMDEERDRSKPWAAPAIWKRMDGRNGRTYDELDAEALINDQTGVEGGGGSGGRVEGKKEERSRWEELVQVQLMWQWMWWSVYDADDGTEQCSMPPTDNGGVGGGRRTMGWELWCGGCKEEKEFQDGRWESLLIY
jgi:hypothetical protein